jgi:hypothetical protein
MTGRPGVRALQPVLWVTPGAFDDLISRQDLTCQGLSPRNFCL